MVISTSLLFSCGTDHPSNLPSFLHDALPILIPAGTGIYRYHEIEIEPPEGFQPPPPPVEPTPGGGGGDRKSPRLNSSHRTISYAVFSLKKIMAYPGVFLVDDGIIFKAMTAAA